MIYCQSPLAAKVFETKHVEKSPLSFVFLELHGVKKKKKPYIDNSNFL